MRRLISPSSATLAASIGDSPVAWDDWLSTRYEQKALREGRAPHYVTFRRRG